MQVNCTRVLASAFASATLLVAGLAGPTASAAGDQQLFITLGAPTRPPIGWMDFCIEYAPECETKPLEARDVVLTPKAWNDLGRINKGNVKGLRLAYAVALGGAAGMEVVEIGRASCRERVCLLV